MEQRANRKKVKCRRCKGFGHFAKTCKLAEPTEDDDGVDEAATQESLKRYNSQSLNMCTLQLFLKITLCCLCRVREEEDDDGGPSTPKPKKQKKAHVKKGATKKTPIKKKLKKAASAPEARVVRSLKAWLGM
jgi:hypothetical protein